jgi:predicted ArsR family transcriptional regulator
VVIIEADYDPRTRARVLAVVSEHGPVTASAIGRRLGLTPAAVRRHLDALAEQGAISARESVAAGSARGRGRPARHWVVAEAGHEALAADYDHLAAAALRYLRDAIGPEAVASFARSRVADLETRYAGQLASAGTDPMARAEALVDALRGDGFAATVRPVGDGGLAGIQVCQGHCPVQHVAQEFPQLCEAETDAFSRLLGVHVQRLSTLARGQHVCTTYVPAPTIPTRKVPTS